MYNLDLKDEILFQLSMFVEDEVKLIKLSKLELENKIFKRELLNLISTNFYKIKEKSPITYYLSIDDSYDYNWRKVSEPAPNSLFSVAKLTLDFYNMNYNNLSFNNFLSKYLQARKKN